MIQMGIPAVPPLRRHSKGLTADLELLVRGVFGLLVPVLLQVDGFEGLLYCVHLK